MANSLLTPTMVTRKALQILHNKLTFVGNVNRQYDDSFAQTGAKIGDTLKIRLPNEYTVRTGKTLDAQDTSENSTDLAVATQKGVDMNFSTKDLSLDIDDYAERILEPAMAVLASSIEEDAFNMVNDVYNHVGTPGTTPTSLSTYLDARAKLNQYLAPKDLASRCVQLGSPASAALVNGLVGTFNPQNVISEQYRQGMMGRNTGGFGMWYENDLVPSLTLGSQGGTPAVDTSSAADGDTTLHIDGVTAGNTWTEGTVFTVDSVMAVHPETKQQYGFKQQFVVTADTTFSGGEADVPISPTLRSTGARQNISALPANDASVTLDTGSASEVHPQNLAYHKDAFAFATADLEMPQGVHFAAREMYDGISMRIVRQYDINNDNIPCRVDVLYGYKTLRPQLACRVTG